MSMHKNNVKKEKYGAVCLRNIQNIKILMKYYTAECQAQERESGFFYTMSIQKNHFKKEKYGT